MDNFQIAIPGHGTISYSEAVAEKRFETKRPDVVATFEEEQIFFEIYVSHAVDTDKEKFFIEGKYKSVEIDLSGCLTSTFDEIKNLVLNETRNKRVIFWQDEELVETKTEKQNAKTTDNSWVGHLILLAIAVLAFFGVVRWFSNKRRG